MLSMNANMRTAACLSVALCWLLCVQQSAATRTLSATTNVLTYVEGTDPKGQSVTIPALTVWTWCGFNSMHKIKAEVNATDSIGLYITAKRIVKTAEVSALGVPGDSTCRGKNCEKSLPGRLIKYNRCVAVGNFDLTNSVNAMIIVSTKKDGKITGIIAGIVIACVGAIACCIVSWLCCLKKIVCCCC